LTHLRTLFSRGRHAPDEGEEPEDMAAPQHPVSPWTAERLALAQELWGEGFLSPGGSAEVLRYTAPFGLTEAMSLLLLGVGAGGPPRVLASEFGVWVAACDSDAALLAEAADRIRHAGMAVAKRITVEPWNPAAPRFRRRAFHHIVAFEALRDAVPRAVLAALGQAIKPAGQLVLQELVADAPLDPADPTVAAWCRLEHRSPDLPTEAVISETLERLGFDINLAEDQSSRHVGLAVQGWKGLLQGLHGVRPPRAHAAAMIDEAERWTRRIGLLHAGRIRMLRWHAIASIAP
jgi:hypothetical protein